MKKVFALFFIFLSILFISCDSDNSDDTDQAQGLELKFTKCYPEYFDFSHEYESNEFIEEGKPCKFYVKFTENVLGTGGEFFVGLIISGLNPKTDGCLTFGTMAFTGVFEGALSNNCSLICSAQGRTPTFNQYLLSVNNTIKIDIINGEFTFKE